MYDPPDEEDLDVVLDRDELRIVHAGFGRELLVRGVDVETDGVVSEYRLVLQEPRRLPMSPIFVDDAVFRGSHAFLLACLTLVCRDRSLSVS